MTLGDKQRLFAVMIAELILWVNEQGYQVTMGDAFRSPNVFGHMGQSKGYGHRNSNHKLKLAVDLNLFKDGQYLSATEDHRFIGEYWESLNDMCRWGGRFSNPDGNHYSMVHNGTM